MPRAASKSKGPGLPKTLTLQPGPAKEEKPIVGLQNATCQFRRLASVVLHCQDGLMREGRPLPPEPVTKCKRGGKKGYDLKDPFFDWNGTPEPLQQGVPVLIVGSGVVGTFVRQVYSNGLSEILPAHGKKSVHLARKSFLPLPARRPVVGEHASVAGLQGELKWLNGLQVYVGTEVPMDEEAKEQLFVVFVSHEAVNSLDYSETVEVRPDGKTDSRQPISVIVPASCLLAIPRPPSGGCATPVDLFDRLPTEKEAPGMMKFLDAPIDFKKARALQKKNEAQKKAKKQDAGAGDEVPKKLQKEAKRAGVAAEMQFLQTGAAHRLDLGAVFERIDQLREEMGEQEPAKVSKRKRQLCLEAEPAATRRKGPAAAPAEAATPQKRSPEGQTKTKGRKQQEPAPAAAAPAPQKRGKSMPQKPDAAAAQRRQKPCQKATPAPTAQKHPRQKSAGKAK